MKRVIEGKLYNTDTADCIASYENNHDTGNFAYYEESLYVTKKGGYFVAGSGNAASKYSRAVGSNAQSGGTGMTVLTKDEALVWCETHGVSAETIMECFEVEEG